MSDMPVSSRMGKRPLAFMLIGMLLPFSAQWHAHAYSAEGPEAGCKSQFNTAGEAISTEMKDYEVQEILATYLNLAWHTFWNSKDTAQSMATLDKLERLIRTRRIKGNSPESKQVALSFIEQFGECMERGTLPKKTAVAVETYYFNGTRPGGKGRRAGQEGEVYLFVDGVHIKSTDIRGRAGLEVPVGAVTVQAIVPSSSIATAIVQVLPGKTTSLQMILDDGKEVTSPVELSISSVVDGVLDRDADDFVITLLEAGTPRPAVHVGWVELEDDYRNSLAALTDEFQVDTQGRLSPMTMDVIRNAVLPHAG